MLPGVVGGVELPVTGSLLICEGGGVGEVGGGSGVPVFSGCDHVVWPVIIDEGAGPAGEL